MKGLELLNFAIELVEHSANNAPYGIAKLLEETDSDYDDIYGVGFSPSTYSAYAIMLACREIILTMRDDRRVMEYLTGDEGD